MTFVGTGEIYEGSWINGQMTGFGKYFYNSSDDKVLSGQFYNGEVYGNGIIKSKNYIYRGIINNGTFDGFGRLESLTDGKVYEGNFSEGVRVGYGKEYFRNQQDIIFSEYEGFWKQDMKQGHG